MKIEFDLTAVIPARLESSRVEKKVFQELSPKESLLTRKIRQLRALLPRDRVVVNTEDEDIANVAQDEGATVVFRSAEFAKGHDKTFSELIMHVIQSVETEHVCWTPFVVPFFDENEFRESFSNYAENVINGPHDSLVSVVRVSHYFWDINGPLNYCADMNHMISQDLPEWFQVTNGNYMAPLKVMRKMKYVLGENPFLDKRGHQCLIDIDTLHDLNIARAYEKVVRGQL